MLPYLLKQYERISEFAYYNFDIYHLEALNHLVGDQYSSRDLQILSLIANTRVPATPSLIKEKLLMQPSTISNRLAFYEKQELIVRAPSKLDLRTIEIAITPKGKEFISINDRYMKDLVQLARKSISMSDALTLLSLTKKLKKLIQREGDDATGDPSASLDSQLLSNMIDYFIGIENDFLDTVTLSIKQRDLFILTELFVNFQMKGTLSIKQVAEHLLIPYQTIVSKVRKFQEIGYLSKLEHEYVFAPEITMVIREYISLRIIIYYETMSHFTPKEQQLIHLVFDLLKKLAISIIQKN